MDSEGILPIRVYIKRRQTTVAKWVSCWPVYEFCMEVERFLQTILMVMAHITFTETQGKSCGPLLSPIPSGW